MAVESSKSASAFRTISEVADALGLPQHILRYWETRFPQLRPLQRAGNRRYYRPDDVALVERINLLLNHQGYTVKGVQKLLSGRTSSAAETAPAAALLAPKVDSPDMSVLISIRDRLSRALAADDIAARI
jgi:DNA-binding transcriptional MerR regulator